MDTSSHQCACVLSLYALPSLYPHQKTRKHLADLEAVFELRGSQREPSSQRVRTSSHESNKVKNLRGSLISEVSLQRAAGAAVSSSAVPTHSQAVSLPVRTAVPAAVRAERRPMLNVLQTANELHMHKAAAEPALSHRAGCGKPCGGAAQAPQDNEGPSNVPCVQGQTRQDQSAGSLHKTPSSPQVIDGVQHTQLGVFWRSTTGAVDF
ncbi:unnamed protein product, partial [Pleuronectes platessa]